MFAAPSAEASPEESCLSTSKNDEEETFQKVEDSPAKGKKAKESLGTQPGFSLYASLFVRKSP